MDSSRRCFVTVAHVTLSYPTVKLTLSFNLQEQYILGMSLDYPMGAEQILKLYPLHRFLVVLYTIDLVDLTVSYAMCRIDLYTHPCTVLDLPRDRRSCYNHKRVRNLSSSSRFWSGLTYHSTQRRDHFDV